MIKRPRLTAQEKWMIISPIIKENKTISSASKQYNRSTSVIRDWIRKYQADGFSDLEKSKSWKRYPVEVKKAAVEDVLRGKETVESALRKYHISDRAVLKKWIADHTNGKELIKTSAGRVGTSMKKGRQTTVEERIEITQFTLARDYYDYQSAIKKYGVSYHQIYSWIKKYKELGIEGLQDGRGRNKPEVELSELERLRLENKRLQARNEYLEIKEAIEKRWAGLEYRYNHFR